MDLKKLFNSEKILEKLSKFYQKDYEPAIYKDISLESLLVYGIYVLKKKNLDVSEENIFVQTYLLFPQRYSLPNYPFFPNIVQLNQSWFRCRSNKNFITGNSSVGFNLTKNGLKEARKVENLLKKSIKVEEIRSEGLIPSEITIINSFKTHPSFLEFQEKKDLKISELEFCLLIKVRQTASHTLFDTRFLELEQIFKEHNEEELLIFLQKLKKEFNYFFIPIEEKSSMMKNKDINKK